MSKRSDYISWEDYFMAIALLTAKRSKDPSTQVGACIIDKENRILAVGYNGFPRNCSDDVFPWCKDKDDYLNNKNMYVVHAEVNAILNKNAADISGSRLYTTLFPCNECTKLIIQSGIQEVVYISDKYGNDPKYLASKRMLNAVGVNYRKYVPNQSKIILNIEELIKDDNERVLSVDGLNVI